MKDIRYIQPGRRLMIEDDAPIEVVQRYKRRPVFQVLFELNTLIGSGTTPEQALIDAEKRLRVALAAVETTRQELCAIVSESVSVCPRSVSAEK